MLPKCSRGIRPGLPTAITGILLSKFPRHKRVNRGPPADTPSESCSALKGGGWQQAILNFAAGDLFWLHLLKASE